MEIVPSEWKEPTESLSPALTNPDMILPYQSSPQSSTPPARDASSPSLMSPFFANQSWMPLILPSDMESLENSRVPLGVHDGNTAQNPRPLLPGAWQTEEDLNAASDTWTNRTPPLQTSSTSRSETTSGSDNGAHESAERYSQEPQEVTNMKDNVTPVEDGHKYMASNGEPLSPDHVAERPLVLVAEDENDPFSHAAEILANAKRRLTDMEDNLSRARRSLSVTPLTTRSRMGTNWRRVSPPDTTGQRSDSWNIRSTKNENDSTNTHSRVISETSVPSPASNLLTRRTPDYEKQRSSSALGSINPDSSYIHEDELESPYNFPNGLWGTVNRSISLGGRHRGLLEPLREDDSVFSQDSPPTGQDGTTGNGTSYFESKEQTKQVTRARSSLQMRDLHERMQELRGQLTSLKLRTDRENMHRRSLQTLKTPSPFTVARDWTITESYMKHTPGNKDRHSENVAAAEPKSTKNTLPMPPGPIAGKRDHKLRATDATDTGSTASDSDQSPKSSFRELHDNSSESTALSIDDIASQLSTGSDEFHDSSGGGSEPSELSIPVMEESHENRPDAFDYGHFFLHSGMGTFSRISPGRRNSQSSVGSAETEKAAPPMIDERIDYPRTNEDDNFTVLQNGHTPRASPHSRKNSADSISTVNTFATAAEGSESLNGKENNEDDGDWSFSPSIMHQQTKSQQPDETILNKKVHGMPNGTYLSAPNKPTQTQGRYTLTKPQNGSSVFSGGQPSVLPALLASAVSKNGDRAAEVELTDDDTLLVQDVLQSLQTACKNLSRKSSEVDKYEKQIWRQRLKAAQQILEGETDMDGCTF